jgi:hypothetical protein
MEKLLYLVALLVGVIIGLFICRLVMTKKTLGRLRIDYSEPYEPAKMFVELKGVTPDIIAQYKFVTFEVINESYLSRD